VQGAETSLVWALEASDAQLRAATFGGRGTDLLIETPDDVSMLEQLLFQVRIRGVRVTLAHPERSPTFQRDPAPLERLAAQQVLLEVNADALLRDRGSHTRRLTEHLCRAGIAHVMASDAHRGTEWRPVGALAAGAAALASLVGEARADWMTRSAPGAIVAGDPLPEPPPVVKPRRRRWPARQR
jgi:protein-tyrosine phosphatase